MFSAWFQTIIMLAMIYTMLATAKTIIIQTFINALSLKYTEQKLNISIAHGARLAISLIPEHHSHLKHLTY